LDFQQELKQVTQAFGWNIDAIFALSHAGENRTYVVELHDLKYAVRRYRPNHYTFDQVTAEIEWIQQLAKFIAIPSVIQNVHGDSITQVETNEGHVMYVVSQFVEGNNELPPTETNFRTLGALLKQLHDGADTICQEMKPDWKGWNRPLYDVPSVVKQSMDSLLKFQPLTPQDKDRCISIASKFNDKIGQLETTRSFVHADLHFGNIIATSDKWYCLDFDECGFGHRVFDLGVVTLWLQSMDPVLRKSCWASFKDGYGNCFDDAYAQLGTALRVFYMTGKIPLRQDIAELRMKPEVRINRYLGWVESELD
jgi:Ser/Thr protein kinase RdoA (MazF antagonist)